MTANFLGLSLSLTLDTAIALIALIVSIITLAVSFVFWRKTFRPIITATVKTHAAGNELITFNLVIRNSGTIPAKHIKLAACEAALENALGAEAHTEQRSRWLACFHESTEIYALQNDDRVSCSFGTSKIHDLGFWKYKSVIPITIKYQGWFGKQYTQKQELRIVDSDSFTGYMWGDA